MCNTVSESEQCGSPINYTAKNTEQLVFKTEQLLEFLTRFITKSLITLEPGDTEYISALSRQGRHPELRSAMFVTNIPGLLFSQTSPLAKRW